MQPTKRNTVHCGHLNYVTMRVFGGAELFIDDECANTMNDLFAPGEAPTLICVFREDHEFAVDVCIKPQEIPRAEIA